MDITKRLNRKIALEQAKNSIKAGDFKKEEITEPSSTNSDNEVQLDSKNYDHKKSDATNLHTFLDMPMVLSHSPNIINFVNTNKKIKIFFKFDWKTYESQIIIKGLDTQEEIALDTPQIPLMGGCFSNFVSTRMVTGQIFVSSMLEMVRFNLDYLANERYVIKDRNYDVEIIKIDRCFYAPFLIRENKEKEKEYQPILEEKYPEALEVLKNLKSGENYWEKYHDNH